MTSPPLDDLQRQTLRTCTALHSLSLATNGLDWPGSLVLAVGLDQTGAALSLAANIAGAVCLTLEADQALLRAAQRAGACDFVVNTLDEALRAIKNEIRKHRPLSVALQGDPAAVLEEIVARGVAPQLFTAPKLYPKAAAVLHSTGALVLELDGEPQDSDIGAIVRESALIGLGASSAMASVSTLIASFLDAHPWELETFAFATSAEVRAFDSEALDLLADSALPADGLRRHWLSSAPRLFPRDRYRTLWLTRDETASLRQSEIV